jgi:two-component system chemotaxis sensor kinase CheA
MAQVSNVLHNRYASDNTVDELMGISNQVARVVSDLQESVMNARMLPIQQLFNRFPRMVRDLSQTLGKDVDLILEGGETEMDRTIIEDITDPLIHLLRNSLDHGIETSEKRLEKGKSAKGILKIRAFKQEKHAVITIEDDGAGLNLEKIKQSAIKKGVINPHEAEAISHHDLVNLIFETGLSTAENVSDVSGRGVGMDIVRTQIVKLNGIIDVETKEGEGTKFTIKLPLNLVIFVLKGLLVKIHNETYALPMDNIVEIVRVPRKEIKSAKKQSVIVIRDKVHPVIWLHDYFKLPREQKKKNVSIVVLGVAEKRFGIVVDELIGNQEIVFKSLGSYIGKVDGISGATILGNGSVACIFDVAGLSRMINGKVVEEYKSLITTEDKDMNKINNKKTEEI